MNNEASNFAIPHWIRAPEGVAFTDVPTRPSDRLPDFIIVGAAKAGTTAMYHFLQWHPNIHMCYLKEPHFFSTDLIFERGLDWYRGLYADARPGEICGEASTSYTRWPSTPQTPRRLHQFIPNAKLIYLVREPVSRIISDCLQTLKYSRYVLKDTSLPLSVDALLAHILDEKNALLINPVKTSEYITQIEQYLRFFAKTNMLVVLHEDFMDSPYETITKIFEFLGVDGKAVVEFSRQYNVSDKFTRSLTQEQLVAGLRRVPGYQVVKGLLPRSLREVAKRFVSRGLSATGVVHPMSETTKRSLAEHFKQYNRRLADYLERDLSGWDILGPRRKSAPLSIISRASLTSSP
jgi:Sulfotransferase domain